MASTRFCNDRYEYNEQQKQHASICNNRLHEQRTKAYDYQHIDFGLFVSHMPNQFISKNAVDVESQLYGIRASDLVNKRIHVTPDTVSYANRSFVERLPVIMPAPMFHEPNRPFIP